MSGNAIIRLIAISAVLGGLLLTVGSVRTTPQRLRQLERKTADLHTLQEFSHALSDDHGAIKAYRELPDHKPPDLDALLKDVFPNSSARVSEDERRSVAGGWYVRRMDITLDQVKLEQLGTFLERAETARPPWKLRNCNITTSAEQVGYGRVLLLLEGLQKGS